MSTRDRMVHVADHDVEDAGSEELGIVAEAADRLAALEAGTTTVDGQVARPGAVRRRLFAAGITLAVLGLAYAVIPGAFAASAMSVVACVVAVATVAIGVALIAVTAPVRDGRAVVLGVGAVASAGFVLCSALPSAVAGQDAGMAASLAFAFAGLCLGTAVFGAAQARWFQRAVSVFARHGWTFGSVAFVPTVAAFVLASVAADAGRAVDPWWLSLVPATAATAAAAVWYRREEASAPIYCLCASVLVVVASATLALASSAELVWCSGVLVAAATALAAGGTLSEYSRDRRVAVAVESIMEWSPQEDLADHLGEAAETLLQAVEFGAGEDPEHTNRVIEWALGIARELDLPPGRMRVISLGALFHDVGKIAVPDDVLNKPGALTDVERRLVEQHATAGFQLAARVNMLWEAALAIRHHHEWVDGSGYPDGLVGDKIPIESRIIAVCDMYDALTTPRPYRAAMSRDDALMMMRAEVGTHLDAECFDAFERVISGGSGNVVELRPA